MVMGRKPRYKKKFCKMLIDHMSNGNSFRTFSLKAGVTRKTLYEWANKYPEFADAKAIGEDGCLAFFEKILVAKMSGQDIKKFDPKKSDTACLLFAMKTRFYKIYGDVQKHEIAAEVSHIKIDKQDEEL